MIDARASVSLAELLSARQVDVVPRLALTPADAAAALDVSRDFFDDHVLPELRVVRRGRKRIVPVRELERWLEENAGRLFE